MSGIRWEAPSSEIVIGTWDDVIVFYNNPPAPEELIGKKSQGHYHAGGIYNCRCYEEPVLDIDDVSWPHKVYHAGRIQRMSKKQFTKLLS